MKKPIRNQFVIHYMTTAMLYSMSMARLSSVHLYVKNVLWLNGAR